MFSAKTIAYKDTGYFSRIILDYLDGNEKTKQFYSLPPNEEGLRQAIEKKKAHKVNRELLVSVLKEQYQHLQQHDKKVSTNIESLLSENTFTICTAHQPNLFTGPLYFLYKILHAIRLAEHCKEVFPLYDFVPVYYMGSEDADLEELNHFVVNGKKYEWKTKQKGAVGRMKTDRQITALINELEQQLGVEKHGAEVISMFSEAFKEDNTIKQATFELVHRLFSRFGLVVLIPDHPALKSTMVKIFEDDLFNQQPSGLVSSTCEKLGEHYKIQAHPRKINLFYLKGDTRERIELENGNYTINNTELSFTSAEIRQLLQDDPSVFSPNVILRGLFQETILPNLAFIGGGGELAYWLQFMQMFEHYSVPFPLLIMRNSFLVAEKKWLLKCKKTGLPVESYFMPDKDLSDIMVNRLAGKQITLNGSYHKTEELFREIHERAGSIDKTLTQHVAALQKRSIQYLKELEKKMLRSEKRKHTDSLNQVTSIKNALFPGGNLQERVENFSSYYAKWGKEFIDVLYQHSPVLEQQFTILEEGDQSN